MLSEQWGADDYGVVFFRGDSAYEIYLRAIDSELTVVSVRKSLLRYYAPSRHLGM